MDGDAQSSLAFQHKQITTDVENAPVLHSVHGQGKPELLAPDGLTAESNHRVRVFARVRPARAKEDGSIAVHAVEDVRSIQVIVDSTVREQKAVEAPVEAEAREFIFDGVFATTATQEDVFTQVGLPVLQECIKGFNGTIFAYGQTGSGKTHSLLHRGTRIEEAGLLLRLVSRLFQCAAEDVSSTYEVEVAAVQVYNEQVDDLLHPNHAAGGGQNIGLQNGGVVPGLTWNRCQCAEKVIKTFDRARNNLVYAETKMNKASSRSHAIFQIKLSRRSLHGTHGSDDACVEFTTARLSVVDLAGSERTKKSGVEGMQFREATSINTSLLALGNVVSALAGKRAHIPFRDSKLTRLLEGSLGGNCKTILLVCVNPVSVHVQESLSTLEFASRAMHVQLNARANICLFNLETKTVVSEISNSKPNDIEARAGLLEEAASWQNATEQAEMQVSEAEARISSMEIALEVAHETVGRERTLNAQALLHSHEKMQEAAQHSVALHVELAESAKMLRLREVELDEQRSTICRMHMEAATQEANITAEAKAAFAASATAMLSEEHAERFATAADAAQVLVANQRSLIAEEQRELEEERAKLEQERWDLEQERARLKVAYTENIRNQQKDFEMRLQQQVGTLQSQLDDLSKRNKMEQNRRIALVESHEEERIRLAKRIEEQRRELCMRIQETEDLRTKLSNRDYVSTRHMSRLGAEITVNSGAEANKQGRILKPTRAKSAGTRTDIVMPDKDHCRAHSARVDRHNSSILPPVPLCPLQRCSSLPFLMQASPDGQRSPSIHSTADSARPLTPPPKIGKPPLPTTPPETQGHQGSSCSRTRSMSSGSRRSGGVVH